MLQLRSEALLRRRFGDLGLWNKWTKGAACALFWALERLDEDLWARGVVCPAERAVMLGATSKRVRVLLARLQRRVPASVRVVGSASMDAVAVGLVGLQGWCQVVRLDLQLYEWRWMDAAGAGRLAGVLGQCCGNSRSSPDPRENGASFCILCCPSCAV